jgi:hypothetical protein
MWESGQGVEILNRRPWEHEKKDEERWRRIYTVMGNWRWMMGPGLS